MKMKRIAIAGLAALVVTCGIFTAGTVTSNAMTYDQALKAAGEHVPETATLVNSEKDWSKYEFNYRDDASTSDYEVEVSKKKKMVTEVTMEYDGESGGAKAALNEKEATTIAQELFPDASIEKVNLEQDDNGYTYSIDFSGNGFYGDVELNAETGTVNEYELHYGTATVIPVDDADADKSKVDDKSGAEETTGGILTEDQVTEIVLSQVPGATIDKISLEKDDGIPKYEVEARLDNIEYDFDIHAITGVILEMDQETITADDDDDLYDDSDDWDDDDYDDDWDDDDYDDADDDDDDDDADDDGDDDDDDDDDEDDDDDDDEEDDD